MSKELCKLILYFIIYSIIGWLWETVYCSIKAKKFVYRGFLIGPYCPIYGFGIIMVLYLIEPFHQNIVLLYIFSTLIVTLLEYITAYTLEKIFHTTWWDYHNVPLNIQGRVALPISIFWGFCCVMVVKYLQPLVSDMVTDLYNSTGEILPLFVVLILTVDSIVSVMSMMSLQNTLKNFRTKLEEQAKALKLSVEERAEHFSNSLEEKNIKLNRKIEEVREKTKEKKEQKKENLELILNMRKLKLNQRRMLKAFPDMKLKRVDIFKNSRNTILNIDKYKNN